MIGSLGDVGMALALLAVLVVVALVALWVVLPFAVFSARRLLLDILLELRRTNALLSASRADGAARAGARPERTGPSTG